ncbi:hypothetical protein ACFX15_032730 [Malus domestica]
MLHCKYLNPLSFKVNTLVAATSNTPVLLPMSAMKLPGFWSMTDVTRSPRTLTSASAAAKASQNTTTVDDPRLREMEKEKTKTEAGREGKKIKGRVVLMKKNFLGFNDLKASVLDRVHELFRKGVSLRLISSGTELQGEVGKAAYLENWVNTITPLTAEEITFDVSFDWDKKIGVPGALIIRNEHHSEFYLKSVTLEDVPGEDRVHFVCNSWVYPAKKYQKDRVFFANKTYLSGDTPGTLKKFREEELENLRGDNEIRELKEWDRVYGYAYYNNLGNPDKSQEYARPVLGGPINPYPRRGRTGRRPTKKDCDTESRLNFFMSMYVYVPRDEQFGSIKMSDLLAYTLKSVAQFLKPGLPSWLASQLGGKKEFDNFQDVLKLYKGGIELPDGLIKFIRDRIPAEMVKELFRTDGEKFPKFPMPQVIKEDDLAWRTDEEFAREMLAGVNPVAIRRLEEFPPVSKLDRKLYGDQTSKINREHIEHNLNGLSIDEAIKNNKLFILDHHDTLMPYLWRIINKTSTKIYASRTLLFLQDDGTLKPLAIELSWPHDSGDRFGCESEVYTPSSQGVECSIWQLAKTYVAVNDSGFHNLVSHWLRTHAVIEPFVIATNRQLSVLHPIHKLLHPHFHDTMYVNAVARQILVNAGGFLEKTVFPEKFSMEWSSAIYKNWIFPEQALPVDLIKRGMAVEDPSSPHGVRLLVEDYPYAADGLEVWSAIKTWVKDYCSYYYKTDKAVQMDTELKSWWKELREEGHGDKKDEPWWPKMQTRDELIESCTTIIWIASALHAAVNYGQYPYGGYFPNRPSISRRFMPKEGTPEYEKLKKNPNKVFLETFAPHLETLLGMALIEVLSRHPADEVYLGRRETAAWTTDTYILQASEKLRKKLDEIEEKIRNMNNDEKLKNRIGPAKIPYTLMYPSSEAGLTGKGIPNSVSI